MPKPGPRTTYKYPDAFKSTAVRLSELPEVTIKDVAESLCIHPFMLSRWRKQVRDGVIVASKVQIAVLPSGTNANIFGDLLKNGLATNVNK